MRLENPVKFWARKENNYWQAAASDIVTANTAVFIYAVITWLL